MPRVVRPAPEALNIAEPSPKSTPSNILISTSPGSSHNFECFKHSRLSTLPDCAEALEVRNRRSRFLILCDFKLLFVLARCGKLQPHDHLPRSSPQRCLRHCAATEQQIDSAPAPHSNA